MSLEWDSEVLHLSPWELYRLRLRRVERPVDPYLGRDSRLYYERKPQYRGGLAGSAPGRMETFVFYFWHRSPYFDGPGDAPDDHDDYSDTSDESDGDSDQDDRNNPRRERKAMKAAALLLKAVPITGVLSPVGGGPGGGHGASYRQVRTSQHVPRGDPMRQMSTTSSTSGGTRNTVYNGRAFRLQRTLSAPLQGVLDHVTTECATVDEAHVPVTAKEAPVKGREQLQYSTATRRPSYHSPGPEPFPAYCDYLQQATLSSSPASSPPTASSSSSKAPRVQVAPQKASAQRPAWDTSRDFSPLTRVRPTPNRRGSETKLFLSGLHSAPSHLSSPTARSPAYHPIADDSSLRHAAIDGPSPSTTYSSAQCGVDDSAPPRPAAPATRPPGKEDVSPWVRDLVGGDGEHKLAPEEGDSTVWRRRRRRGDRGKKRGTVAGFVRRLFPFFRGTRNGADGAAPPPSSRRGIRRLWSRVSGWRGRTRSRLPVSVAREKGSEREAKPAKPAKGGKAPRTAKPTRSDKPTSTNRQTRSGPAAKTEKRGRAGEEYGTREVKKTVEAPGTGRKREHRTAREVTYDILSPLADAKANRAREAAPLLGAANMVFMAAS